MTENAASDIAAVLFDMGGVIVELAPLVELLGLDVPADVFWPAWLQSPIVRAFERGDIDPTEFGAGLVAELDLPITPEELVDRFQGFVRGLFPGAASLVESLRGRVITGVLSNTNALHWDHQSDGPVIRTLFDRNYLSFQLGLLKPDRSLFDFVLADLGLPGDRVLFLDDNQINVDGGTAAGLRAELVRGPDEAAAALVEYGLIDRRPTS